MAVIVTIIIVIWEWVENPGGIFRDASGTNWGFIFETAISWLMPTFGYVTLIAVLIHLAWFGIGWYRQMNTEVPDEK